MGIPIIQRMTHSCNELLAAFKLKNKRQISRRLAELEIENKEELKSAQEFQISYLLSLHGMIKRSITQIKRDLRNPARCEAVIANILEILRNIVDQREVRDKIIKETIHPIFKKWGYKKKARAFAKKEGAYAKKVNVYTSMSSEYYEVLFIFEIEVKGPDTRIETHRVEEKWFKLTEDADIETLKAEIAAHLLNAVKPFLDKYR